MEKLIKFNGIPLSPKTGIRNIIFDTSRYSAGMEAIRGFGTVMSESNLANIETVNLHFVLRTEELANLAYIYSLFRTLGVLVVENDYLLDKLGSSLANSLAEDRMVLHDKVVDKINGTNTSSEERFSKIHKRFKSLCMVLDNLSIKSKVNTADGYDVNMNLSLYKNSFTEEEQVKYMKTFELWLEKTGFNKIKDEIAEQTNKLGNTSVGIDLKYYNVEALNAIYKNNLITSEFKSFRLQQGADLNEKVRTDEDADNVKKRTTENKIGLEDDDFNNEDFLSKKLESVTSTIKIPNNCIMEIELITNNNIANIPIKGNSLMEKSIIGLGKTNFSCKLLFKEEEELSLVQQLKTISDKNIIGHKLQIEHPLIQLFDFYSGDILNMSFNSLENQHGIVVTMVFNINGYRYERESLINNSDSIGDMVFKKKSKNDKLFGSFLEIYNNYLNITKENLAALEIMPLENYTSFEINVNKNNFLYKKISEIMNSYYNSYNWIGKIFPKEISHLTVMDFILSYSTQFTNAYYKIFNLKTGVNENLNLRSEIENKIKNEVFEKRYDSNFNVMFYYFDDQKFLNDILNQRSISKQLNLSDMNSMYNIMNYFDAAFLTRKTLKKSYINPRIGKKNSESIEPSFLENVVRPITTEMFNDKINGNSLDNRIYRKIYEEFFLRMISIINVLDINENIEIISQKGTFKYHSCMKFIQKCAGALIQIFNGVLSDGKFIKRITEEVFFDEEKITPSMRETVRTRIKEISKEFSYYYKNNNKNIEFTLYNIFLLRLTCFNLTENKYGAIDKITKNEMLNDLLKGTILCTPMLLKSDNRTDTFGLCVETCFGFLGQAISDYNFKLDSEKLFWFSELKQQYGNNVDIYNSDCVYVMRTKYEDLGEQKGQIIGDLAKKDIDYLYGEKIPRLSLFSLTGRIFYETEILEGNNSILSLVEQERGSFFRDEKYNDIKLDPHKEDSVEYFIPKTNIGNIHIPSDNKQKFTTEFDIGETKETKINTLMKARIISNNDPFNSLLSINKAVCDNIDTLFPDYVIVVNVKETIEDETNEYYVQLKNITSISISKNPKTKIKTANFTISMASKGFYNFNLNDGAFSIKTMQDGKIRGFIIKPGCEVRIMLGYNFNNSYSIFNGLVVGSQEVGNSLMITCADFASTLYNFIPGEEELTNESTLSNMIVTTAPNENEAEHNGYDNRHSFSDKKATNKDESLISKTKNFLKKNTDETPEENDFLEALRNKKAGINNPNMHMFEAYGEERIDTLAQLGSASYSAASQIMLVKMGYKYRPYFENVFKEESLNRDLNYLATNFQNKIDLTKAFGSGKQNFEVVGNSIINIYDVDLDYEAYGYVNLNHSNTISHESEEVEGPNYRKSYKVVENNLNPGEKREYMLQPCQPLVPSEDHFNNNGKGAWFGVKRNHSLGFHAGADYRYSSAEPSKNVYSVADGTVIFVHKYGDNGAGNRVRIKHDDGIITTAYYHLDSYNVSVGNKVKKGQVIGKIGGSGLKMDSWAKHLHFEVHVKKTPETLKFFKEQLKLNKPGHYIRVLNKSSDEFYVNPELFLKGQFGIVSQDNGIPSSLASSYKGQKGKDQFTVDFDAANKDYFEYAANKLKSLEGFAKKYYTDKSGKIVGESIGYGFFDGGVMSIESIVPKWEYLAYKTNDPNKRLEMSKSRADEILRKGLEYYENDIRRRYKGYDNLKPNEKVALLDLAWKYSPGNKKFRYVYNFVSQGRIEDAVNFLLDKEDGYYVYDDKHKEIEGLVKRRDYVIETLRGR
jgi:murein DD-endopeptidase MepM/ murein hydrolase activator NlpD/GH24 family phage-related lysozyme (muramidase)